MKPQTRNIEIDNLRAVAIIGTMFAHMGSIYLNQPVFLSLVGRYISGGEGVILFFAISGYVISLSYIPKLDSKLSFRNKLIITQSFFIKRIFRLFPATLFWVGVMFLLVAFGLKWGVIDTLYSGLATLLNLENIYILLKNPIHNRYFIYWSLSLEAQFYFLLPFFLILIKSKWRRLIGLGIALVLLQLLTLTDYHGQLRGECMIVGVMLYVLLHQFELFNATYHFFKNKLLLLKICAFTLIIFHLTCFGASSYITNFLSFSFSIVHNIEFSFLWTLLVAIASLQLNTITFPKYFKLFIYWLGSRSFTLYLAHYPIMCLVRGIAMKLSAHHIDAFNYPLILFLSWLALLILVVEISYRKLEMPMTALGRKLANNLENKKIDKNQNLEVETDPIILNHPQQV